MEILKLISLLDPNEKAINEHILYDRNFDIKFHKFLWTFLLRIRVLCEQFLDSPDFIHSVFTYLYVV